MKGCHCGCRASGFTEERITNRGLYGILIPLDRMVESANGPYHAMRHPHPMEIALVNGLEPAFVNTTNGESLRLALAGVPLLSALCLQTVHGISELMSSWPNIKNIIELTDKCKEIEFFGAASDDLSVLRCKTCFDYLSSKDKSQSKDVVNIAKKGLGKYVTNNIMYLNILLVVMEH